MLPFRKSVSIYQYMKTFCILSRYHYSQIALLLMSYTKLDHPVQPLPLGFLSRFKLLRDKMALHASRMMTILYCLH